MYNYTKEIVGNCLCEGWLFVNASLDLQEDVCLPVVKFDDLIEFVNCTGEHFLISTLNSVNENVHEFRFASRGEGGIERGVFSQVTLGSNRVLQRIQYVINNKYRALTPIARAQSDARSQYSLTLYLVSGEDSDPFATCSYRAIA